jgi:hypothetical protein
MMTGVITVFSLVQIAALAVGSQPPPASFTVHTADGALPPSPLQKIDDDWSISLEGTNRRRIPGSEVISLRRDDRPLPPFPKKPQVVLANGDRIAGKIVQIKGDRLRLIAELSDGKSQVPEMTLPLTFFAVLWLVSMDESRDARDAIRRLQSGRRREDVAILRNGDVVDGTLKALDENVVQLSKGRGEDLNLERSRVAAIALSTELARAVRPKGVYARLVLADGSRLAVLSAQSDGRMLDCKTTFGAAIQVSVEEIAALDLYQGRADYLSDLKPKRYEFTPYLGVSWPFTTDASVAGNPIRVAGNTYDKGLGMHSQSRLSYQLNAGYRWFESWVGLDDQTGKKGSASIQVLVDGKAQVGGQQRELTLANSPRPIRVNVSGARELALIVEFGRYGDVQDHVDWADARLVK